MQAWLKVVTPLQNSLRDKQREALVSYLVGPAGGMDARRASAVQTRTTSTPIF